MLPNLVIASPICTPLEAKAAEEQIAGLKTWKLLYQSYKKYSYCDDGSIGEAYSSAISQLLILNWHDINKLALQNKLDPEFEKFILKHIDETVPADDLKIIAKNAQLSCANRKHNFCEKVLDATK